MQTIEVATSSRTYDVHIACELLPRVGEIARSTAGGSRAMVVSNTDVAPLYSDTVLASLRDAGYDVHIHVVESSETVKNMAELARLLEHCAEAELTRDDVVVALGGGVVGDLAGFAAATYMRGCKLVQVPTSLLAMVDSSVGGKTAVDLVHGKNLAGAFFQPRAVVASVEALDTIAPTLFADSCGEVIKYGVMCDPDLFASLEKTPLTESRDDHERLGSVIARRSTSDIPLDMPWKAQTSIALATVHPWPQACASWRAHAQSEAGATGRPPAASRRSSRPTVSPSRPNSMSTRSSSMPRQIKNAMETP